MVAIAASAVDSQHLVNTGLSSVPVLSAKFSCSTPSARRMLTYRFDIRASPFARQYWPCFRPRLAPPAISVGRLWLLCVVLAPLPNITIVLSSTLPLRSLVPVQPLQEVRDLRAQEQVVLREIQLAFFVRRVRQIVVGFREPEFQRERVADPHAVFAVQHERDVRVMSASKASAIRSNMFR